MKGKCPICGKVDYLEEYYDRFGIYSGRACSVKCAQELPGQGYMYDYDPEEDVDEDVYPFDLEGERDINNLC